MYFHVQIETSEKVGKTSKNKKYFELDKTDLSLIEERVLIPFLEGEDFQFDGYFLNRSEIKRLVIKSSEKSMQEAAKYENKSMPAGVFIFVSASDMVGSSKYTKDITNEVLDKLRNKLSKNNEAIAKKSSPSEMKSANFDKTKVFIVHGRDDTAKLSVARFIDKLGFKSIILHEQVSAGQTIIEKIEEHTNVGFALVLYTTCDVGGLTVDNVSPRARQNVVFEHGYLIAKLGRRNVCALVQSGVETPNDISGVVYVPLDDNGAWQIPVAKELKNSGYDVDMNKVV